MKAGSLVECINDIGKLQPTITCSRPTPKKGDIETVDTITPTGYLQLVGFHFTIDKGSTILEIGFDPKYWREVQPPMDLSFVDELQKEVSA